VLALLARRVGAQAAPLAPAETIDESKRTVEMVKNHG
jgi:hypothetical protein